MLAWRRKCYLEDGDDFDDDSNILGLPNNSDILGFLNWQDT